MEINFMYEPPHGYNGYEGGAPYWFLPGGNKTYDYNEYIKAKKEYFNNQINYEKN